MKRIVLCPKCESKLAVFDLGKPINQKCPKCGNAFVVETDQNKTVAAAPATPVAAPATPTPVAAPATPPVAALATPPVAAPAAATPVAAPAAAPAVSTTAPVAAVVAPALDAKSPADLAPPPKEIALKKPTPRPDLSKPLNPAPSHTQEPLAQHSGISFLHVMVIIGLLVFTIILQVMAKMAAQKHYVDLATRLHRIESKILSQK